MRPETGRLYLDFFYRGVRCREQTALPDTAENRRKVQALLTRIEREIRQGQFDYASTFPGSPRAARFGVNAASGSTPQPNAPPVVAATPATPTVDEFATTWRMQMAPQWKRLHREGVDDIINKHVLPAFGARPVGDITKADVLAFRAKVAQQPGRAGKTLSPARVNKIMTIFRQMMTAAADQFELKAVFDGVKRLKAGKTDVQPFTLEEVDRIREAIRPDFRNYVTVRFFTGMRTGEINGLKWKNVDFDAGLVLVRETFSGGQDEDGAKTLHSVRDIPMLPQVRQALLDQRENRHPDSPYVFASRGGGPLDAHNFANRVWYPLLRYLDIEKRRPYQTRHTTATLMLAAGENPEWIARLMGHANTQMLFTVYSRYVPNLTRQDGLAISGLLSSHAAVEPSLASTPDELLALLPDELRRAVGKFMSNSANKTKETK